ncbi:type I-E CRISPR-associated protein Cas6/Cse3/CasE [Kitasatospora purpeofusca]|uniref:type I-E CRISPR-associated protein Cas6/Cse3/CasE n=1 Tax=Kitasatospora purpeofusca TaxID=67352 RepID=UPI0036D32ACA
MNGSTPTAGGISDPVRPDALLRLLGADGEVVAFFAGVADLDATSPADHELEDGVRLAAGARLEQFARAGSGNAFCFVGEGGEERPVVYVSLEGEAGPLAIGLPDLTRPPGYGHGHGATKSLAPLLTAMRPGLSVRYRIAANPIRKPGRTTRELYNLSPVVPLRGAAADDWWTRQADTAGLQLTALRSEPFDAVRGTRRSDQNRIKHDRVLFEGTARITDPDLLRTRLTAGIGKGKAYGCGLLGLAPHRSDQ